MKKQNIILDVMLISPDTIKAMGEIDQNVDDGVIGASIRAAQNIYVQTVIGTNLLNRLQELVYNAIKGEGESINDPQNAHYKALLDHYLRDVIAYKVASEICVRNSLKIKNAGVVQLSDTNVNAVSLADIKYLKETYDTYYNAALNRMVTYLSDNKDAFPELTAECKCGGNKPSIDGCNKNKYGNIGLYLGK